MVEYSRLLSEIGEENAFVLEGNIKIRTLNELTSAMKTMSDTLYASHVSDTKNDFSNWIKHCFDDEFLADKLSKLKTKEEMIEAIQLRIIQAKEAIRLKEANILPNKPYLNVDKTPNPTSPNINSDINKTENPTIAPTIAPTVNLINNPKQNQDLISKVEEKLINGSTSTTPNIQPVNNQSENKQSENNINKENVNPSNTNNTSTTNNLVNNDPSPELDLNLDNGIVLDDSLDSSSVTSEPQITTIPETNAKKDNSDESIIKKKIIETTVLKQDNLSSENTPTLDLSLEPDLAVKAEPSIDISLDSAIELNPDAQLTPEIKPATPSEKIDEIKEKDKKTLLENLTPITSTSDINVKPLPQIKVEPILAPTLEIKPIEKTVTEKTIIELTSSTLTNNLDTSKVVTTSLDTNNVSKVNSPQVNLETKSSSDIISKIDVNDNLASAGATPLTDKNIVSQATEQTKQAITINPGTSSNTKEAHVEETKLTDEEKMLLITDNKNLSPKQIFKKIKLQKSMSARASNVQSKTETADNKPKEQPAVKEIKSPIIDDTPPPVDLLNISDEEFQNLLGVNFNDKFIATTSDSTIIKAKKKKHLKTGVGGFDDLIDKGILEGSSVLVSGGPGSGKTTFCIQQLGWAAEHGEKCLFISLEEKEESLIDHMKGYGLNPEKYLKEETLKIKKLDSFKLSRSVEALLAHARGELMIDIAPVLDIIPDNYKPDRVVLDSLSSIAAAFAGKPEEYRIYVEQLFNIFAKLGVTSFIITEIQGSESSGHGGVEDFLADGVINFYNIKKGSLRQPAIEVLKMRGVNHKKKVVPFGFISGKGLEVYPLEEVFHGN